MYKVKTKKSKAERSEMDKYYAKQRREYIKSLSPEELAEIKQNRIYDKQRREEERDQKDQIKKLKGLAKRELAVLQFMLKTDVLRHHHGQADSQKKKIQAAIEAVKRNVIERLGEAWCKYDPYIWNYQGEGNNYNSRCHLDCLFSRALGFNSIYDVPLDGTYIFYCYDSGMRGLGTFDWISVKKVEDFPNVPKVNPGAFPPITAL